MGWSGGGSGGYSGPGTLALSIPADSTPVTNNGITPLFVFVSFLAQVAAVGDAAYVNIEVKVGGSWKNAGIAGIANNGVAAVSDQEIFTLSAIVAPGEQWQVVKTQVASGAVTYQNAATYS